MSQLARIFLAACLNKDGKSKDNLSRKDDSQFKVISGTPVVKKNAVMIGPRASALTEKLKVQVEFTRAELMEKEERQSPSEPRDRWQGE